MTGRPIGPGEGAAGGVRCWPGMGPWGPRSRPLALARGLCAVAVATGKAGPKNSYPPPKARPKNSYPGSVDSIGVLSCGSGAERERERHSGAATSLRSQRSLCRRTQVPSAAAFQTYACCFLRTRASRMHGIRSLRLAGSPAVASRPAEAARCLESRASTRTRVYHPQYAECGENFLRTQQAHTDTRPMPA